MTRRCASVLAALAALVLLGREARAELIEADFVYSWQNEPPSVSPSSSVVSLATVPDDKAQATLPSAANPNPIAVMIPGAVVSSSSASNPPDHFETAFDMQLSLTDTLSGQSGTLHFSGSISGATTANQASVMVTFDSPVTKAITLGEHTYAVTINPTLAPLLTHGSHPARIDALVSAQNTIMQTPEPSTLVLGGMAMAVLGITRRRKRGSGFRS